MGEDFKSLTAVSTLLTYEELNKRLSKWFNCPITFSHWEYVGDASKGDSYLSELIRIKIHGNDSKGKDVYVQVALKTIPKSISRKLTFRSDQFFRNEANFYNDVIPVLLNFQAKKKMTDPFVNVPQVFMVQADGDNDVVCLEDLTVKDFGTAHRQDGIDYDHCQLVLKTFAKFHALSYAFKDQEPDAFEKIQNVLFETYYCEEIWDWYEIFWSRLCKIAIDAVEIEYPNSIYVDKIKEFAVPETYFKCANAIKSTTATGVISHGDSWTTNFLFKYKEGSSVPLDAMMIDFQLSRCAPPVLDIAFFIYACTTKPLRDEHYHDMLKYYHQILSTQIREMGSDPEKLYSWETFMSEIKKYSFFGLAFSFESTPMIVLEPEDAFDMTLAGDKKLNINEVWPVGPFKTKAGRRREADNIAHCVDNGYI